MTVPALVYLRNVVTLHLDEEKCVGCGMCSIVCPHAVFNVSDGAAHVVRRDACMECGACAMNCPTQAVTVEAGVGCATAVINTMLGHQGGGCCCVIETKGPCTGEPPTTGDSEKTTCC